jgi:replicative DNA helicase
VITANQDAERAVLGAILIDSKAYDEAAGLGLIAEDFLLDANRKIFRHLSILAESSSALDLVTLVDSLHTHKELVSVGDVGYVSNLIEGVPDRPSVKSYVRIVKEQAAKRKLISACTSVTASLSEEMRSGEAMEYLTDQMLQIQTGSDDAPALRTIEFSEETYAQWLAVAEGNSDLVGLPTGLNSIDLSTTGIRKQQLWVIAGRTGDGKTNLALQMAAANCREGTPVGLFSIEMPKESILHRLWAGEAGVDFNHVHFPRRLSPEIRMKIERAMVEVGKWPLHIVEESGIPLAKLIAKSRLMIRRHGVKLLIVDYLQMVTVVGRDDRERVSKVSKALQCLAKDTGVPVVSLSQLTRPKDGNENNRPTKFNLKESGSLENDADVVILIYRPVDDHKMKTHEDEIIIDKQRSGLPSIEQVRFMPWLRFAERQTR